MAYIIDYEMARNNSAIDQCIASRLQLKLSGEKTVSPNHFGCITNPVVCVVSLGVYFNMGRGG